MVKTSVLLATYNGEKFLGPLIDSLKKQDWEDIEILFQDDGSSDGTLALLEKAAAEDGRFSGGSESGKHLGAKRNFLSLMRQDDADRTALCDQDDIWLPEKIRFCENALDSAEREYGTETPILIHSDSCLIDGNGKVITGSFFRHQGWDPKATELKRILVQNNATGCTMMMNKALRDKITRYFDPDMFFMHDWFIALTASAYGKIVFLDKPLVQYRQHETNEVGASKLTLPLRALSALRAGDRARKRIYLTYRQAENLLNVYGKDLCEESKMIIREYLETEQMRKKDRVFSVIKKGYRMQNPLTRMGQIFFG